METVKHYKYPFWLELVIRGQTCVLFGLYLFSLAFIGVFIITLIEVFYSFMIILIASPFFLIAFLLMTFIFLGSLLQWPQIEVQGDRIRFVSLIGRSRWIAIEDIISISDQSFPADPFGLMKQPLVIECNNLPWLCRLNQLFVFKKNPVFIIGQRIQGFDELRELLEGNEE